MSVDVESGLSNFRVLRASEETTQDRNEATTRFQVIDRLLREVLGWEPTDCACEVHRAGDYADYIVGNPRRFAVWEAKREGVHFTLPAGLDKLVCKLETLRKSDDRLRSAIFEANGRGVPGFMEQSF